MNLLADTGPIVALLNRRDQYHTWAKATASELDAPVYTCEAVLAEAHHLLAGVHDGTRQLNALIDSGGFDVSFRYMDHIRRVHELMSKYANVPMSFADACLVTISETFRDPRVFTIDDDFTIYRQKRNRRLDLIMPSRS
ncbi:MAG: type II toxin-antitoxin system VapC family toxin [Longimicrobiales bacterium]